MNKYGDAVETVALNFTICCGQLKTCCSKFLNPPPPILLKSDLSALGSILFYSHIFYFLYSIGPKKFD